MKKNFDLYLETTGNPNLEKPLTELLKSLYILITDSQSLQRAGMNYDLVIYHRELITHYIDQQQSTFHTYALFIKNNDGQRIRDYIETLAAKCDDQGYIWTTFHEYASYPQDESEWGNPDIEEKDIPVFTPKMEWRFDSVQSIEDGATMYDERIAVSFSWFFEGKNYLFKGYWYVTSVQFICKRLETIDPYYRRYMLLSHNFNLRHLQKQLAEELEYLSTVHPTMRELCLKHHFEYDGQSMFYER